jgi:hypothetical protein
MGKRPHGSHRHPWRNRRLHDRWSIVLTLALLVARVSYLLGRLVVLYARSAMVAGAINRRDRRCLVRMGHAGTQAWAPQINMRGTA